MEKLKFDPEASRTSRGDTQSNSNASPGTVSRGIQALFSAYRSADFADAEGFVVQLGSILTEFSDEVVMYVTSPKTGIQRRSKWPPTISEVLEACEQHQDYLRKVSQPRRPPIANRLAPPSLINRPQGALANVHVPESSPRYERLVEWTKTAEPYLWKFGPSSEGELGLWVALSIWQEGVPRPPAPQTSPRDLKVTQETLDTMAKRFEPTPSQEPA